MPSIVSFRKCFLLPLTCSTSLSLLLNFLLTKMFLTSLWSPFPSFCPYSFRIHTLYQPLSVVLSAYPSYFNTFWFIFSKIPALLSHLISTVFSCLKALNHAYFLNTSLLKLIQCPRFLSKFCYHKNSSLHCWSTHPLSFQSLPAHLTFSTL